MNTVDDSCFKWRYGEKKIGHVAEEFVNWFGL